MLNGIKKLFKTKQTDSCEYQHFSHANSKISLKLPKELGKPPVLNEYNKNGIRAWWPPNETNEQALITSLEIFLFNKNSIYYSIDKMWKDRWKLGCKLYGREAGYSSCEKANLNGFSILVYDVEANGNSMPRGFIKSDTEHGIVNLSITGKSKYSSELKTILNTIANSFALAHDVKVS